MTSPSTAARKAARSRPGAATGRSGTATGRSGGVTGRSGAATGRSAGTTSRSGSAGTKTTGRRRPAGDAAGRSAAGTVAGGVGWAGALVAAVALGQPAVAVVSVPVAAVAAFSAVRMFHGPVARVSGDGRQGSAGGGRLGKKRGRVWVQTGVAVAGAVLVPLAALVSPAAAAGALSALVVVVLAFDPGRAGVVLMSGRIGALVAVAGPAAAAMSLVLARGQGSNSALALLGAVFAYDAGAVVMGHGRTPIGGPVGVVFGLAGVSVVAMFVAALMNPPFSGARPWIVYAAVGLLAAVGVRFAGQAAAGVRLPALRRLDSLALAGPAWVIAMTVIHPG